jgi:hypothetical protein
MPRYSITGPLGPEAIDYEMVPGADPLETLLTLHRDGLGKNAVRLVEGRLVVADPADRELCAGAWKIVRAEMNGSACVVTITIPAFDPADGRKAA